MTSVLRWRQVAALGALALAGCAQTVGLGRIGETSDAASGDDAAEPDDAADGRGPAEDGGLGLGARVADLAAGGTHTCVRTTDGRVACWGMSYWGQAGVPGVSSVTTPRVVPDVMGVRDLALGLDQTAAVLSDGTMRYWGWNAYGQAGNGATSDRVMAIPPTPSLAGIAGVAVCAAHTCAWLRDGTVRCAGAPFPGMTGDMAMMRAVTTLTSMPGLSGVVQVRVTSDVGIGHGCARHSDGTVSCWGANPAGELGDGTTETRVAPVRVLGLAGVTQIAISFNSNCAALGDGTVRCWGRNDFGQLGDGTTMNRPAPVAVPGLRDVVEVTGGQLHYCARTAAGRVFCWGRGSAGALGNGDLRERGAPQEVTGLPNVTRVTSGFDHTCALTQDGQVYCWGRNEFSQLGDGTTESRSSPVRARL